MVKLCIFEDFFFDLQVCFEKIDFFSFIHFIHKQAVFFIIYGIKYLEIFSGMVFLEIFPKKTNDPNTI